LFFGPSVVRQGQAFGLRAGCIEAVRVVEYRHLEADRFAGNR
jgi:hypothetical protein